MGQNTVGTLSYGIDLGKSIPWDEKVLVDAGLDPQNEDDFSYCLAYLLGGVEYDPKQSAEYQSKVQRATGDLEIRVHLVEPDTRYVLTVQNTEVRAFNWEITTLNFESLNKKALASKDMLKVALKKLGVKGAPKPSWLITSAFC